MEIAAIYREYVYLGSPTHQGIDCFVASGNSPLRRNNTNRGTSTRTLKWGIPSVGKQSARRSWCQPSLRETRSSGEETRSVGLHWCSLSCEAPPHASNMSPKLTCPSETLTPALATLEMCGGSGPLQIRPGGCVRMLNYKQAGHANVEKTNFTGRRGIGRHERDL